VRGRVRRRDRVRSASVRLILHSSEMVLFYAAETVEELLSCAERSVVQFLGAIQQPKALLSAFAFTHVATRAELRASCTPRA